MTTITAFIKRHPLLTYFGLTFVLSWGALLIVAGSGGISANSEPSEMLLPFMYLAMIVGPSVAGILLTGLVSGRAGFRELLSRLFRWQVDARWFALALLIAPLLWMATLFALSLTSPVYLPDIVASDDKASLLLIGIAVGLVVGILEELGWTGFAIPRLRLRYGVLTGGLSWRSVGTAILSGRGDPRRAGADRPWLSAHTHLDGDRYLFRLVLYRRTL